MEFEWLVKLSSNGPNPFNLRGCKSRECFLKQFVASLIHLHRGQF